MGASALAVAMDATGPPAGASVALAVGWSLIELEPQATATGIAILPLAAWYGSDVSTSYVAYANPLEYVISATGTPATFAVAAIGVKPGPDMPNSSVRTSRSWQRYSW